MKYVTMGVFNNSDDADEMMADLRSLGVSRKGIDRAERDGKVLLTVSTTDRGLLRVFDKHNAQEIHEYSVTL